MTGKISCEDDIYPKRILESINDYKPLYYRGDLKLLDNPTVAIVGSRKASYYGRACAKALAKCAVEYGTVVVSGLAAGIDSEAHTSCLESGGNTIAVLGNGLDIFYPQRNKALQEEIEKHGLLLSEYEDGKTPQKYTFPVRNRIISAISDAVVIVEAGARSGSLITAECAVEQGKMLYAIPGNISSPNSFGTNKLICEQVSPLINFDELFHDLGLRKKRSNESYVKLSKTESRILDIIRDSEEISIEQIRHKMDINLSEINAIITILEMKGIIFCEMGKVGIAKL
ncbi:MAG: DNA-processing protein DprA [Eubacterium sp.]|nr:DNA-processing protein DprA [Eubacterium sp.]